MSLRDKLIKNSTIELTSTLTDSKIYTKKDMIPTSVPRSEEHTSELQSH